MKVIVPILPTFQGWNMIIFGSFWKQILGSNPARPDSGQNWGTGMWISTHRPTPAIRSLPSVCTMLAQWPEQAGETEMSRYNIKGIGFKLSISGFCRVSGWCRGSVCQFPFIHWESHQYILEDNHLKDGCAFISRNSKPEIQLLPVQPAAIPTLPVVTICQKQS